MIERYAPIIITAVSFKAFTKLFWRQLIKISIGQFLTQKHLDLCLILSLTHAHTQSNKQTNTDVDIVTCLGPVVSFLVWFLVSHLSFRWKKNRVYQTLLGLDQGHCTLGTVFPADGLYEDALRAESNNLDHREVLVSWEVKFWEHLGMRKFGILLQQSFHKDIHQH